ncbi:MAG TPA: hypothetical protein VGS12_09540 [Caulobacteraceae bacterium]|nr:hypothetical protein [Caulobacteraceae bacterium]
MRVFLVLLALGLAAAAAPRAPTPSFWAVRTDRQMKVVVDASAEKQPDGTVGVPLFIFYAAPLDGHDLYADYFVFDCGRRTARLSKTVGVSKYVEPLDLKDTGDPAYVVPVGSMMSEVMDVACHGARAAPPSWKPLTDNLRQISADYYRGFLGQMF